MVQVYGKQQLFVARTELYGELRAAGYGAICLECRHVKAGLSAMRNKTDRNDARGIAQLVRLGWFRQVHVKSEEAQRTRMLLVNRQQLLTKALDIENSVRGSLKVFGLRVRVVVRRGFEARVLERGAGARGDRGAPVCVRLVVMMYVRYPLSLRNVEDLLAERGIDISHETVRFWWNRFGPM